MRKDKIRTAMRAQKSLLDDTEKQQAAASVFEVFEKMAAFMLADKILMYHALPDELQTVDFIDRWADRKQFFLPRVNGVNLEILPYNQSSLQLGAFQIEEPTGDDIADINDIELIVVPGVAYDRNCNRVGRGKGYYDRLLAESRALKVGVAYDFQVVDEIDVDPHDVRVDLVITDKGVYRKL